MKLLLLLLLLAAPVCAQCNPDNFEDTAEASWSTAEVPPPPVQKTRKRWYAWRPSDQVMFRMQVLTNSGVSAYQTNDALTSVRRLGRSVSGSARLMCLLGNRHKGKQYRPSCYSLGPTKKSIPTWKVPLGLLLAFIAIFCRGRWGDRLWVDLVTFFGALFAGALILLGYVDGAPKDKPHSQKVFQPVAINVQPGEMPQ